MMTKNSYMKKAIRDRMATTGECYLEAARHLNPTSAFTRTPWEELNTAIGGGLQPGALYLMESFSRPSLNFLMGMVSNQERAAFVNYDYVFGQDLGAYRAYSITAPKPEDNSSLDMLIWLADKYGNSGAESFSISGTKGNHGKHIVSAFIQPTQFHRIARAIQQSFNLTNEDKLSWLKQLLPFDNGRGMPFAFLSHSGIADVTYDTGNYLMSGSFARSGNDITCSFKLTPSRVRRSRSFKEQSVFYDAQHVGSWRKMVDDIKANHRVQPFTSIVVSYNYDRMLEAAKGSLLTGTVVDETIMTFAEWKALGAELGVPVLLYLTSIEAIKNSDVDYTPVAPQLSAEFTYDADVIIDYGAGPVGNPYLIQEHSITLSKNRFGQRDTMSGYPLSFTKNRFGDLNTINVDAK
jgi:hypothetical protein